MKKVHYLTGLPRSGSTLLANILGTHPKIHSTPSSPLCHVVQASRRTWSNDTFLKAQLDSNFELIQKKLKRTTAAIINEWSNDDIKGKDSVIDKNRGWLACIEWLRHVFPNFKMIVTIRDLRDVYASIEKRHRQTLLLDFPDNMEHNMVDERANVLFADSGIVGSCLKYIYNIGDVPDIVKHLFIWRYEDFVKDPKNATDKIFEFLEVDAVDIDFDNITQITKESDSFYNMKYPHVIQSKVENKSNFSNDKISPRILNQITNKFAWYYDAYYPELTTINSPAKKELNRLENDIMLKELEQAIESEIKV